MHRICLSQVKEFLFTKSAATHCHGKLQIKGSDTSFISHDLRLHGYWINNTGYAIWMVSKELEENEENEFTFILALTNFFFISHNTVHITIIFFVGIARIHPCSMYTKFRVNFCVEEYSRKMLFLGRNNDFPTVWIGAEISKECSWATKILQIGFKACTSHPPTLHDVFYSEVMLSVDWSSSKCTHSAWMEHSVVSLQHQSFSMMQHWYL